MRQDTDKEYEVPFITAVEVEVAPTQPSQTGYQLSGASNLWLLLLDGYTVFISVLLYLSPQCDFPLCSIFSFLLETNEPEPVVHQVST
ncbi:hypothetical protein [Metabacillus herbersteinensis]|uniref:hypothetical protein n=1 Tax=Metabacillus herbersteinensis TaxID=283816 RepID=UPI0036709D97